MYNVTIDEEVYSTINEIIIRNLKSNKSNIEVHRTMKMEHKRPTCSKCKRPMAINQTRIQQLRDSYDVEHLYFKDYKCHTYRCEHCYQESKKNKTNYEGYVTESIPGQSENHAWTNHFFVDAAVLLSGYGITLKKASQLLHTEQSIIAAIHKAYLKRRGGSLLPKNPDGTTKYSRGVLVDEFKLHSGRVFCTMVLDYDTLELLYLQKGRGKQQIRNFQKYVGADFFSHIRFISCDMSAVYPYAFKELIPDVKIVYDLFHIRQKYNELIMNGVRKEQRNRVLKEINALNTKRIEVKLKLRNKDFDDNDEKEIRERLAEIKNSLTLVNNQAENMKFIRLVIMSNRSTLALKDKVSRGKNAINNQIIRRCKKLNQPIPDDLKDYRTDHVERLETACKANEQIKIAYELGEELWDILDIRNDENLMINLLDDWLDRANSAHIRQLTYFAKMIRKRWDGIINRSTYHVSSGRIEGLNAWIKNRRRMSFGISSFDYFALLIWEHTHPLIPRKIPSTNNYNPSKKKMRIPRHVVLPEPTIFRIPRDFKGNELQA